jgi:hypothetical protein
MNLYYETDYGPTLQHAGNGNGQHRNHKYIARVKEGNRYRYFYSQAEIAAYKAAKSVGGAARAVGNAVANSGVGKAIGIGAEKRMKDAQAMAARKQAESNMATKKFLARTDDDSSGQREEQMKNDRLFGTHTARYSRYDMAKKAMDASRKADREAYEAKKAYNNSLIKKAKDAGSSAAKVGNNALRAATKVGNQVGKAASDAGRQVARAASDVGRQVTKAGSQAANVVSKYASSALKDIQGAGKSIQKGASQVAKSVSKVGSQAVSSVAGAGSKAVNAGKSFIAGLFGKKKK